MSKPTREEMSEWFKVFDVDGSGKIEKKEVKMIVRAFHEWMKEDIDEKKIDATVTVR